MSPSDPSQVIGGAAHATLFRPAGQVTVGGKLAQEYIVTVDVKKATAVNGLGDFITKDDAKTLPKAMVRRAAGVRRRAAVVAEPGAPPSGSAWC